MNWPLLQPGSASHFPLLSTLPKEDQLRRLFARHRTFVRIFLAWLILASGAVLALLVFHPETQSVELEGRLWGVYTDNPAAKQHGLDYYLHTDEGHDYVLQAEDVAHIPVGSRVRLKAEYPYNATVSGAVLNVPRVSVVEEVPAALKNGGTQKWISVLCKYADHPEEPYDVAHIKGLMSSTAPGMSDYFGRASNKKLILDGRTVVGPYQIKTPHYALWSHWDEDPAKRIFDVGRMGNLCAAEVEKDPQSKIKLSEFDGIIFFMNFDIDGTAKGGSFYLDTGKTKKIMRVSWIPWWEHAMLATTAHEVGHGEEFGHSTDSRSLKDHSLGNPWDVMGDIWIFCRFNEDKEYGCRPQYPMAYWRSMNGWIKIATADHTSGVRLYHIMPADAETDRPQALFIPVQKDVGYMLEVRRPNGPYDGKLPPDNNGGALLTWVSPTERYPVTLIDMDGDGNDNPDDGSAVLVPVHLLGTESGITMCILANDDDGGMTIAIGKNGAKCDKV
jgi:hypothetical protein